MFAVTASQMEGAEQPKGWCLKQHAGGHSLGLKPEPLVHRWADSGWAGSPQRCPPPCASHVMAPNGICAVSERTG